MDKRKIQRWHLIYYLRVFDQQRDTLLGHVVDISTDGLKIVSEWPIPTNETFQVWLKVPTDDGKGRRIVLRIVSLWSQPEQREGFYSTGFRIVNPSAVATEAIRELVDHLHGDPEGPAS